MGKMNYIKKLKIEGWTYNPNVEDKLGSVYFDRNDDNYLRVTSLENVPDTYVFTKILARKISPFRGNVNCQTN